MTGGVKEWIGWKTENPTRWFWVSACGCVDGVFGCGWVEAKAKRGGVWVTSGMGVWDSVLEFGGILRWLWLVVETRFGDTIKVKHRQKLDADIKLLLFNCIFLYK